MVKSGMVSEKSLLINKNKYFRNHLVLTNQSLKLFFMYSQLPCEHILHDFLSDLFFQMFDNKYYI